MNTADTLREFDKIIMNRLGIALRRYQKYVAEEILNSLDQGCNFVVVSMPTGSGKNTARDVYSVPPPIEVM